MRNGKLKLGLLAEHDESWIAGVLYLQTVIRALGRLSENDRPVLKMLLKGNVESAHHESIQSLLDATLSYEQTRPQSWGGRFRLLSRGLSRKLRLPLTLHRQVRRLDVDVLFPCMQSPGPNFPVPWVGWVPDLQHLHFPELFEEELRKIRNKHYQQMLDEAAHVVVSSEHARADLLSHYRSDPERVSVYGFRTHAEPSWFEGDPVAVAESHGLPERFLIFPSAYWRHKDHLILIDALGAMREAGHEDICMVLTGRAEDFRHPDHPQIMQDRIRKHGLEDCVHQLGLLPRMEQVQLMRRACAVVQPSRFEGWSMLVEDCRALGKPVILSDIEVHQEQAYPHARYFKAHDVESLIHVLAESWPALAPGPDPVAEAAAREENAKLSLENGHQLKELFESLR